jgi:hypothetical protein
MAAKNTRSAELIVAHHDDDPARRQVTMRMRAPLKDEEKVPEEEKTLEVGEWPPLSAVTPAPATPHGQPTGQPRAEPKPTTPVSCLLYTLPTHMVRYIHYPVMGKTLEVGEWPPLSAVAPALATPQGQPSGQPRAEPKPTTPASLPAGDLMYTLPSQFGGLLTLRLMCAVEKRDRCLRRCVCSLPCCSGRRWRRTSSSR